MAIKFEMNFSNRAVYISITAVILLVLLLGVNAYTQSIPNPGHGSDQIWVSVNGDEITLQNAFDNIAVGEKNITDWKYIPSVYYGVVRVIPSDVGLTTFGDDYHVIVTADRIPVGDHYTHNNRDYPQYNGAPAVDNKEPDSFDILMVVGRDPRMGYFDGTNFVTDGVLSNTKVSFLVHIR